MTPLDSRNLNSLWCSVMIETWVREGLQFAVVSPGSRSTPLTMAVARHAAVETVVAIDERSAAFHALGLARGGGRPVVLICTSGSAGAHYLPALIEAHETATPLIVVTADRPPELRDCTSGQTINQHQLFGHYSTWYHEFALPALEGTRFAYLRQTTRQAWRRAQAAGPVHLNAPFRDPLPPLPDGGEAASFAAQIDDAFWMTASAPVAESGLKLIHEVTTARGLIVAGPAYAADQEAYAQHVYRLAEATGWPILADGLSPARHHVPIGVTVVSHYDLILRHAGLARDLTPRYVLGLESWPTSKVLREWLGQCQAEMLMVSPRESNGDAVHGRTREITSPIQALAFRGRASPDRSYVEAWAQAQDRATTALAEWMASAEVAAFEGRAAWNLGQSNLTERALVVASSMPVRDWEYFCSPADRSLRVYGNRGANGIDGTISTALGVARATQRPTVLLTGDLAFVHDSNGLMLARQAAVDLTILVINNAGGGIFEHLPIAQFRDEFERLFATPSEVDLGALCAAHGVAHQEVSLNTFATNVEELTTGSGVRVLEINTDRKADAAMRKRGFRMLAQQLGEPVSN